MQLAKQPGTILCRNGSFALFAEQEDGLLGAVEHHAELFWQGGNGFVQFGRYFGIAQQLFGPLGLINDVHGGR